MSDETVFQQIALDLLVPTPEQQRDLALELVEKITARARAGDRTDFDRLFADGATYQRVVRLCVEVEDFDLLADITALAR